jgi:hypothetical protein
MDDITDDAIERAARAHQAALVRQNPGMAEPWDYLDPGVRQDFLEAMRAACAAFFGSRSPPASAGFV